MFFKRALIFWIYVLNYLREDDVWGFLEIMQAVGEMYKLSKIGHDLIMAADEC